MPDLPNLLYVADVPVEASYHGSALLYRLLQQYPADRLLIVEGNLSTSRVERRLPAVRYDALDIGSPRLLNSRFHEWYSRWVELRSGARTRQLPALLKRFEPQAVMTVGHGYSWVTAARHAARRRLPLHLVIHDDWPSIVPASLQARVQRQFSEVYRQAVSRLCVSPQMMAEYQRRYGVAGVVLYPARDAGAPSFPAPPDRLRRQGRPPRFAFAGTVNSPGLVRLLRRVADCLDPLDGQLLLFGPVTAEQASSVGLGHPRIRICGLLPAGELMIRLRNEADALVVPMSFAAEDRINMQFSFPSKLTDYTAMALPLLIVGPAYSSAVQWANDNPGVAETVTSEEPTAIMSAIGRLVGDAAHRVRLAENAKATGDRQFAAARAYDVFIDAVMGSSSAGAAAPP